MNKLLLVAVLGLCAGCATVAQVTTLQEPACRAAVERGFSMILKGQGETDEVAARLASSATTGMGYGIGPRPFLVASPSGADYSFFVQKTDAACVLRLYARQKGFVSYTNNITYIATEPVSPCQCAE